MTSFRILFFILLGLSCAGLSNIYAQEGAAVPSQELVRRAWAASSQGDMVRLAGIVQQCLNLYKEAAVLQQSQLGGFPARGEEEKYQELNDVATCLFIQAEALMKNGRTEEAVVIFQQVIDEFKWAQAWDPRGWYWSVAQKSQASIDKLTGKREEKKRKAARRTFPKPAFPGTQKVIDYAKYGEFTSVGTKNYRYLMKDPEGLALAVGEGIYPNVSTIYEDPGYKKAKEEGRLEGSHWDFVHTEDLEAAFYKWATASDQWGIKLFYLGVVFEKAKMYVEAIKAYQAIVVHFPQTVGWTYWQTPWYPAQAAVAKIRHLVRIHPELNLKIRSMNVKVINGFDNVTDNDEIITFPGKIEKRTWLDWVRAKLNFETRTVSLKNIKRTLGEGKVRLVEYDNGRWQMLVDGKPYVIRGITYAPTKVGQSPDKQTLVSWMEEDSNNNGLPDGPYDSWVDQNRNDQRDADEPVVGDFQLLKAMGVNTLREYHHPLKVDKDVLRRMHKQYGFMVIMGDFLGKYTLGSGADWFEGTDYENPEHRKNMMESVKTMVMEFKDEPYILMWILGNENNYGVASNADKKPEAYFKFVNEVALWIKSVDKNHPVAVVNGDTLFLDIFAEHAPDVDIFSANVYRGDYGFGSFWEQVQDATGKPAFITEFGCPAYAPHMTIEEAEEAQADYHRGNWLDIEDNLGGRSGGIGNALGGVVFEWMDEWWKNYEPSVHDTESDAIGPFPGGYYYEEWFGIVGQGDGKYSPYLRQLRKSYYTYKELWTR
jgi:beta-glucuronidase